MTEAKLEERLSEQNESQGTITGPRPFSLLSSDGAIADSLNRPSAEDNSVDALHSNPISSPTSKDLKAAQCTALLPNSGLLGQPSAVARLSPKISKSGTYMQPAKVQPDSAQPLAPAASSLGPITLAPAIGAAYPYPTLAANPHLLAHQLVSLNTQAQRKTVRIAPLGVLPLPPPGASTIVPDLHTNAITTEDPHRLGELSKSKRRGSNASPVVPEEALSPEERARQKRMLRNRESAARSRDKRRNRNIQLQSAIEKYKHKMKAMEEVILELNVFCQTMQRTLEKHNVSAHTP